MPGLRLCNERVLKCRLIYCKGLEAAYATGRGKREAPARQEALVNLRNPDKAGYRLFLAGVSSYPGSLPY